MLIDMLHFGENAVDRLGVLPLNLFAVDEFKAFVAIQSMLDLFYHDINLFQVLFVVSLLILKVFFIQKIKLRALAGVIEFISLFFVPCIFGEIKANRLFVIIFCGREDITRLSYCVIVVQCILKHPLVATNVAFNNYVCILNALEWVH